MTALKQRSTGLLKETEKDIENAILAALQTVKGCKAWKNQSVGIYDPTKKSFRRRSRYQIKGVSDILGIYKGKMICLEVKTKKGRLSPEQKSFLEEMQALGAFTACVRSVPEALAVLGLIDCDRLHNKLETLLKE